MKDIFNQQNSMLYKGKLYELSVPSRIIGQDQHCMCCAFKDMTICPGKCSPNQHWIEK